MATLRRFRDGLRVQNRVLHALMLRELHTRFGRENIGFLWIMVEPLLFAGLVALMWRIMKGSDEHGISVVAFVVTGYIPLTFFRHAVARSVAVFTANGSLLYHRQVKIVDFILVRISLEVLGAMMAFAFISTILIFFDLFPVPSEPGKLIAGWFLYTLVVSSICFVVSPLSEMSEVLEKFIPALTYIMIPISGAFTLVSWLTPDLRDIMLLSPFVSPMELIRGGVWGDQVNTYYNIWVPLIFSMVFAVIGLSLCRRVRRTMAVE